MRTRHTGNTTQLPVEKIKSMLDNGMRQADVARHFNVSQATISRQAGKAPDKKAKKQERICTCCGLRPVASGNRMLCRVCFRTQSHDAHRLWA